VRRVRDEGATIDVVDQGQVIARLVPAPRKRSAEEIAQGLAVLDEMEKLAQEISASISGDVDAVQMVRDIRRDV
jgi:antitoxin (DNA-binding transcriptional repressor) of toxin-antitoxin stability system